MLAFTNNRSRPATKTVIDLTDKRHVDIDLTTLDDSPPASPRPNGIDDEPPRKRQRVSDGPFLSRKSRDLAACLRAQVKPYIDASLADIPADKVNICELGIRLLGTCSMLYNGCLRYDRRL
ncbi:WD repeat domain-containing protein [Colletotrichum higginsianum]|nr:WD repeat domain-containing protein [Colletotrichum higginsianum]